MRVAQFYLKLTPEEYLEYYQRKKHYVRVRTYQGYSIQFKAEHLRQFITRNGIDGVFEITFDASNRFQALHQLKSAFSASPSSASPSSPSSDTSSSSQPYSPNQRPRGGFKTSI